MSDLLLIENGRRNDVKTRIFSVVLALLCALALLSCLAVSAGAEETPSLVVESVEALAAALGDFVEKGDVLVIMGAGDIDNACTMIKYDI